MKTNLIISLILAASSSAIIVAQNNATYSYTTPSTPWAESFGNHRAVLQISQPANEVKLNFEWRRNDKNIDQHRFLIVNSQTGDTIQNILRHTVNNETCEISFGPVSKEGKYYFYYLPYQVQPGGGSYYRNYLPKEDAPDKAWLAQCKQPESQPTAVITEVQSRSKFDSFYPTEVTATESEVKNYCNKQQADNDIYAFAEDRSRPVRMKHRLPQCWMNQPQGKGFTGKAQPNEYYTFQVALWSPIRNINNISYQISDLTNGKNSIPASAITCFNLEGINPAGQYFTRNITIPANTVQPLWFGVDIPHDASSGIYTASLTIKSDNGNSLKIPIAITISGQPIADRGDSEPWRHSRLRWLNSTLGLEDTPTSAYPDIELKGNKISCLGRMITLSKSTSLPEKIDSWNNKMLAAPIQFIIETDSGIKQLKGKYVLQNSTKANVKVLWEAEDNDLKISALSTHEFDGWMNYVYTITPKREINIKDIRLELKLNNKIAQYILGTGLPGQDMPQTYQGKWDTHEMAVNEHGVSIPVSKKQNWLWPFDSFWLGNANAGLHCELRGSTYSGPLLNAYRPAYPQSWHNDGKGGFCLKKDEKLTTMTVYSGQRTLTQGQPLTFDFALLVTPVKPLNMHDQFTNRYYHNGNKPAPTDDDVKAGVKIINIHHANEYNPFINYPFLTVDKMKEFTQKWHSKGVKVKLYYTLRELSNAAIEIWAIRSLGTEILRDGNGGGFPWLREHFVSGYTPQWYQHFSHNDDTGIAADAAILTTESNSRWYNYYIEGLRWMIKEMDIDGIYMDDVSFGRDILKRMRRAIDSVKPGCIIDLHSNTGFSRGPANQYAEFFPYIDKLWFGESFLYDIMTPTNWLVESSGIPFGLTGDMLYRGGNKWLGMQYGMTVRHPWETEGVICDPRVVWKVWDSFGIADATMFGFWENNYCCPIKVEDGNGVCHSS
ncbi:MAG: glycoside hydrolase domain-containing protein, partial [Muribaculaceae bacterium]